MVALQFDDHHPFFDEALQFAVLNVSTFAVGLHELCLKDFSLLYEHINDAQDKLDAGLVVRIRQPEPYEVPDYPHSLVWRDRAFSDECVIEIDDGLIGYLSRGLAKPTVLRCIFRAIADGDASGSQAPFPETPPGVEAVDGIVHTTLFETTICYLVGGSYERHSDGWRAKGGYRSWSPELQFFRHLRNACFHSNTFNIIAEKNKPDQIDPSAPPTWRNIVMPSDTAMNGRKALGENGFLSALHVLPLLHDLGGLV